MFRSRSLAVVAAIAAAALAGCGGSSSYPSVPANQPVPGASPTAAKLSYQLTAPIAAWKPGVSPSYDISFNNGKFNVLADRTSKAVDIVDDKTFQLTSLAGPFTGFTGNNSTSGPDGVAYDSTHDLFYVGDVNKLVVVNANTKSIVTSITIPNANVPGSTTGSGLRTDEGCYDPDDHIMAFTNNADTPPYTTFISTDTNTVLTAYIFPADSVGAEQCAYLSSTKSFYINNVGDNANPGGALDVIPASSVTAAAAAKTNVATLPEAPPNEFTESYNGVGCNPAGLAIDVRGNMLVGCGDVSLAANAFTAGTPAYAQASQLYGTGKQLHSLILNSAGGLVAFVPFGGSDEVWYDSKKDRYYAAARFWTTSGLSGGTAATSIGVIDAPSGSVLGTLPTVGNVHSVAADPNTGNVFFPHQSTSSAGGGIDIYIAQ
jgi:hypothetical protein